MQTNPDALKGRGIVKLITEEGIASLYRGWGWTMARNAPGSFAVSLGFLYLRRTQLTVEALRWLGSHQGAPLPPVRLLAGHLVAE